MVLITCKNLCKIDKGLPKILKRFLRGYVRMCWVNRELRVNYLVL
jgi:hypothetical protein